jgi:hypothetical protein
MIEDFSLPFHIQRSKAIDAVGDLETALRELLSRNGVKLAAESLGQQVEKARAMKAGPRLSKAMHTRLPALLDQCETLIGVRNDIIHSRMQSTETASVRAACFVHTQPRGPYGSQARVMTMDELAAFIASTKVLAGHLRALKVSPASSRRPPAPDAAGDP